MFLNWPKKFKNHNYFKDFFHHNHKIFSGLIISIHVGNPIYELDPTTNRYYYFGPVINKTSRIQKFSKGWQIAISSEIKNQINYITDIVSYKYPKQYIKGFNKTETLYIIYPKELYLLHDYLNNYHHEKSNPNLIDEYENTKQKFNKYSL